MERMIDDLHKEEWRFWFDDSSMNLYLDSYTLWSRATKRHGWTAVSRYNRIDNRHCNLTVDQVPFTDDIKAQSLKEFVGMIQIKVWIRK
jgi:hypothetical protein